jgi:hypothetical protein
VQAILGVAKVVDRFNGVNMRCATMQTHGLGTLANTHRPRKTSGGRELNKVERGVCEAL